MIFWQKSYLFTSEDACISKKLHDFNITNLNNFLGFYSIIYSTANYFYHLDDFIELSNSFNFHFDIIGLTETKIQVGKQTLANAVLPGYIFKHTDTEASKGGSGFFISEKIKFKRRKDLEVYKPKHLETVFIEVSDNAGPNILLGVYSSISA